MVYLDNLYQSNFIEYASYVIKDRAIPHIDDGFKPVQRRILHALWELDDGKFHKVANVVGHAMRYHPHGDMSIHPALVVLANKDYFIEKQGNFGNIYTGDPAAAARYIECRLTPLAKEVLFNPQITEYVDSYDGRNKEPIVLPAKVPVLLAMGTEGIAVGMATRILPHNLIELMEAQIAYMRDQPFEVLPDFPTGGLMDASDYQDGNGKVRVRARLDTSDPKRILIREVPYGTTTESLINSIEDAARKNKVKIAGINDFTAEEVEVEIRLARGVYTQEVVDALFAFTDCEVSISANLMYIQDNRPQVTSATQVIQYNVDRLVDLLRAELHVEEGQLRDKLHARTLEQIFIEERIYKNIESQKTPNKVVEAVQAGLEGHRQQLQRDISREDIDSLLKIPIRRISLYDINRAKKEMTDIRRRLRQIDRDLDNIIEFSIGFIQKLIEKYRDQFPRRTEVVSFDKVDVRDAARRDLQLCYNKETGYLGYQIEGRKILAVSQYDRVLVIRKDATYSVVDVPDKLYVGKGMLYCGFVDKDLVFNVLYRDKQRLAYIKRCCIEQFILNRDYNLVPDGCRLIKLTTRSESKVGLDYKPKPRLRKLYEEFDIGTFPVRGLRAGGIRLSTKELAGCKIV